LNIIIEDELGLFCLSVPLELPHKKDKEQLPSNEEGKSKSDINIKVKDYQVVSGKKGKKIYY